MRAPFLILFAFWSEERYGQTDALYAFWYALGSPDTPSRHNLLQVLDYLTDARAVPYLIRLLERRTVWTDGCAVCLLVRAGQSRHPLPPQPAAGAGLSDGCARRSLSHSPSGAKNGMDR